MDLFESQAGEDDSLFLPLAERMRPDCLEELVGQDHVAGKDGILYRSIKNDRVFWYPS